MGNNNNLEHKAVSARFGAAAGLERKISRPEILAPAGDRSAFMAALAAGADSIYCGLKRFSARMAAENFTMSDLAELVPLAHARGKKVYIAVNSLIKPDELSAAGRLLDQLNAVVKPDALIIQDLALVELAGQIGFSGDLHLSTLANVSFSAALSMLKALPGVRRVVLPRELTIDEIRQVAEAAPGGVDLELFIHGALCYAVSGRCYWSSFMGGKSGLRGRCVQPCRRMYAQGGNRLRYFSCLDLWYDVLTKLLVQIPKVAALKIEGRKKGPHYIYYTVSAYRMLRDHPGDARMKKTAVSFLEYALGRKGTHYNILPQRRWVPVDTTEQTGSGLLAGNIRGGVARPYLVPRFDLFARDLLRIGYEDDAGHATYKVGRYVPKRGRLVLDLSGRVRPENETPVFLIDRRETELEKAVAALEANPAGRSRTRKTAPRERPFSPRLLRPVRITGRATEMTVVREGVCAPVKADLIGFWIDPDTRTLPKKARPQYWCWLPPVIWPDEEHQYADAVVHVLRRGFRNFVLNAPWQRAFFKQTKTLNFWAGPFCNISNGLAAGMLKRMGFSGVIVSPELGESDYARLAGQSPLPLGIVISGNWPLCISRTVSERLKSGRLFVSPQKEEAWVRKTGSNVWVFPNWGIDLKQHQPRLQKMGYERFIHMAEPLPAGITLKKRPGLWNWKIGLK